MAVLETPDGRLHLTAVLTPVSPTGKRRPGARGLLLILLLGAGLPVRAGARDKPEPFCALIKACALDAVIPSCTEERSRPIKGIDYDAPRCAEPKDLLSHGIRPASELGARVYPFLGRRYRVVYDITGEAPISEARFEYLAEDLPLAARLASRFSKTKYVMRYSHPLSRRFFASRGDKLTGEAELLFLDPEERRRTYFGWGTSKFGPWKLHGAAYLDLRIRPTAAGLAYDVRIRTAPANAVVNAIMRLGIFRGHVIGQIRDTMKDLVGAAQALSPENLERVIADPAFTPEEREKVRALAQIP